MLLLLPFLFGLCLKPASAEINNPQNESVSTDDYNTNISNTKAINVEEFFGLIDSNETAYIFIGFEDCPYCRAFSPKLYKFSLITNRTIYYFDLQKETGNLSIEQRNQLTTILTSMNFQGTPYIGLIDQGNILTSYDGDETTLDDLYSMELLGL